MSLKIKINKEFVELTDAMVEIAKTKKAIFENMNIVLVKLPLEDSSVITTADSFKKMESYKSGLGRVIALPRLLNDENVGVCAESIQVGDYVIFSHEAKYTLNTPVVNFLFDLNLDNEESKNPVICIRDVDVIGVLKAEIVQTNLV